MSQTTEGRQADLAVVCDAETTMSESITRAERIAAARLVLDLLREAYAETATAVAAERARIVAWLRERSRDDTARVYAELGVRCLTRDGSVLEAAADAIERGESGKGGA